MDAAIPDVTPVAILAVAASSLAVAVVTLLHVAVATTDAAVVG